MPQVPQSPENSHEPPQPLQRLSWPLRLADGSTAMVREINRGGLYIEIQGQRTLADPLVLELQPAGARVKLSVQCEVVHQVRMGATTGISLRFISTALRPLD